MSQAERLDLAAYLARVGCSDLSPATDLATLRRLHEAHLGQVPFENLDVRLGRPGGLDLAGLEARLVRRRRGGYCFEQNSLFAAALRGLDFAVDTLEARVRPPGATAPLPRTHMLLAVTADGRRWLADVGFGGDGPLWPVPLDGEAAPQPGGVYAVVEEADGTRVLRRAAPAEPGDGEPGPWRDLYAFSLVPALAVDFQVAHHYTSTHPRSPFVNVLTVQRTTAELRQLLRGRTYVEKRGAAEIERQLGDEEVVALLRDDLGLDVAPHDVRRALADGPVG
jgi:N-hydroxyarylamine O-acetyltransferase